MQKSNVIRFVFLDEEQRAVWHVVSMLASPTGIDTWGLQLCREAHGQFDNLPDFLAHIEVIFRVDIRHKFRINKATVYYIFRGYHLQC